MLNFISNSLSFVVYRAFIHPNFVAVDGYIVTILTAIIVGIAESLSVGNTRLVQRPSLNQRHAISLLRVKGFVEGREEVLFRHAGIITQNKAPSNRRALLFYNTKIT